MRLPERVMGTGWECQWTGPGDEQGASPRRTASMAMAIMFLRRGGPPEHSGGEGSAADEGAGCEAEAAGVLWRPIDHCTDGKAGDELEVEEAVDEGVQKSVAIAVGRCGRRRA